MTSQTRHIGANGSGLPLAEDLMTGADAIAAFIFGDASEANRRRVYHAADKPRASELQTRWHPLRPSLYDPRLDRTTGERSMSTTAFPSSPLVLPGELDEILAEFEERGVRPTRLNILAAALERGLPEDFAIVIADAAERMERPT
jgi:hypothetical protein